MILGYNGKNKIMMGKREDLWTDPKRIVLCFEWSLKTRHSCQFVLNCSGVTDCYNYKYQALQNSTHLATTSKCNFWPRNIPNTFSSGKILFKRTAIGLLLKGQKDWGMRKSWRLAKNFFLSGKDLSLVQLDFCFGCSSIYCKEKNSYKNFPTTHQFPLDLRKEGPH